MAYAPTTHWSATASKPSESLIDGSATFTTDTSRMTMNCAAQASASTARRPPLRPP